LETGANMLEAPGQARRFGKTRGERSTALLEDYVELSHSTLKAFECFLAKRELPRVEEAVAAGAEARAGASR
jgi:hypothetical protein